MDIIYTDSYIVVGIKPAGILSTDEPGGMPSLIRESLGDENACIKTVHRLDRVVSGLMVLARTPDCASELSKQIRDGNFDKTYLAVTHGNFEEDAGRMTDLLLRSKPERKTYVVSERGKDVQEAILDYEVLASKDGYSLVRIKLITGRTHQIRCQFSSHGFPLVGDRKYSTLQDGCDIALWSHELSLPHPNDGHRMSFKKMPPAVFPWTLFDL